MQFSDTANNVDVSGNYAYVAVASAGLQIVDVSDHKNPQIVASLDTSGYAYDVRVVGNYAYIADGYAGLQIVDITNPLSPVLIGSLDTPGDAQDVVVSNQYAYIADGYTGMQIIDISNPTLPVAVGAINTADNAMGVDISGNHAIVANGYSGTVIIIDISDAASPQITGTISVPGEAMDVVARGNLAYVAAYIGGIQIINFADPISPQIIGALPYGSPGGFVPQDIAIQGDYAFAADVVFYNAVPIVNIANPSNPTYRTAIDFSQFGDENGNGIALDSEYVYMAGGSKLFIGRHKLLGADTGGMAPTVSLTSPTAGQSAAEGSALILKATAADDVYVAGVQFNVNGIALGIDSTSPYEFSYQVPLNINTFSVTATAFDLAGNSTTSSAVSVNVTPDPPPTINITAPAEGAVLIEGQQILLSADAADDDAVVRVRFNAGGNEVGSLFAPPYELQFTVPSGINTIAIEAAATDTAGRTTTAVRTFDVMPDPKTTVIGRVVTASDQPIANASVVVFDSFTAQTAADGTFTIPDVPTVRGDISAKASALLNNIAAANASIPFAPASGATTNVGDVRLSTGPTAPTAVSVGYFGNRDDNIFFGQDVFVAYGDRLSSIYSFDGTEFVQRLAGQMEAGSVSAGNSSSIANFFGDNLTFLQLAGQPGLVNKFNIRKLDSGILLG